jgi:catalase
METQIKMISAATAVLELRRQNPLAIDEEVFQHVSDRIERERIKDEKVKMAMIAAADETFKIARQNPKLSEKEILKELMEKIPFIVERIDSED